MRNFVAGHDGFEIFPCFDSKVKLAVCLDSVEWNSVTPAVTHSQLELRFGVSSVRSLR